MKTKDEILRIIFKWKKIIETQSRKKIKLLGSNNGCEYQNDSFLQVCENKSIFWHFRIRDTP